ncbi:unnamed protein product, partial [Mesorhabditis belari]|uniref:A-kinase anchor protein 17A n=1 Tax=Mesorhabditis belari TaxID=2138241 RepID=A0AAF3E932_9BILA
MVPAREDVMFDAKLGIFLRPYYKVKIEIKLPSISIPGQSISNWDLMEKLKKSASPVKMDGIRVVDSNTTSVVFDAELLTRKELSLVKHSLDGMGLKVVGWSEPLKVACSEATSDFPTRHAWEKHFGDSAEKKEPGLRPDTIHLSKVPANWFNDGIIDGPCERLFKKTFEAFGCVRLVDIPICDPLRIQMNPRISGLPKKTASFGPEILFDGYVQFVDLTAFTQAMEALRDRKWIRKVNGKEYTANVRIDFDRSEHLSNGKLVMREAEKDRLMAEQRKKVEEDRKNALELEKKAGLELELKEKRRLEREENRRLKRELAKRRAEESKLFEQRKIEETNDSEQQAKLEETKKLQAERLLMVVFKRIERKEKTLPQEKLLIDDVEQEENLNTSIFSTNTEENDLRESLLRATLIRHQEEKMRQRLLEKICIEQENDYGEMSNKQKKKKY